MSLNLHQAGKHPQWKDTPDQERNTWQHVAAATQGIIAPANVITAGGFVLFYDGVRDVRKGSLVKGVFKIVLARAADLVDGHIAEMTKTKSPLGEALDASIDKLEMAALLIMLGESVPTETKLTLGLRDAGMWALTGVARWRRVSTHPSRAGKDYTFYQWAAVAGHLSADAAYQAGHERLSNFLGQTGDLALMSATGKGIEGLRLLADEALAPRTEANTL